MMTFWRQEESLSSIAGVSPLVGSELANFSAVNHGIIFDATRELHSFGFGIIFKNGDMALITARNAVIRKFPSIEFETLVV